MTDEFPTQKASNAENDSIWWRHHKKGFWYASWIPFDIETGMIEEKWVNAIQQP